MTHERGQRKRLRIAAGSCGAGGLKRSDGGGRPRASLSQGSVGKRCVGTGRLESSLGERPNTGTEETVEPQDPETSKARQGKKKTVHSLIDKVFSRQNLERAWEKVKKHRGRAGIDEVTIAPFEARQEFSLDLLHRKLREGTYRPQPVKRVEIPKSEGGGRKLGIPAVLDRVCQQALVQRMEPIFEPTFLDSAFGYRRGRSPHEARRQVWRELHAGNVWIVDADLRQCFDYAS
jgi:retron-type reverse transcriptase